MYVDHRSVLGTPACRGVGLARHRLDGARTSRGRGSGLFVYGGVGLGGDHTLLSNS